MSQSLHMLLDGFGAAVPELEVTGVEIDSRRVSPGDLFMACKSHGLGARNHGLAHLEQALERGAAAVAWEPAMGWSRPTIDVPEIAVSELSARVGEIAARFYGRPSERMFCTGITGTDGKTSTAYLLAQAMDAIAVPCAYLGTLGTGRIGQLDAASHTTPDPVSLQRVLARLREQHVQACAMEVSSHALDQQRVSGMHFDVAILTNITRDHLDYHGTVERYAAAKRRLFERRGSYTAVLNRDDAHGAAWAQELTGQADVVVYGIEGGKPRGAHLLARALELTPQGIRFQVDCHLGSAQIDSPLLGRFNVYNLLAALGALLARDVPLAAAAHALSQARTVPGRIEGFRGGKTQPMVVVDYAHTPEALAQILTAVRAHTPGRLSCVFGCGGDRDRGKRPLMGEVATRLSDRAIVTDDNPRSEAPEAIVAEILASLSAPARAAVQVIHDRAEAIRTAVAEAAAGDVIVVAGKGHETTQTYGTDVREFSDRRFVAELFGQQVAA